ncbi:nonribosomal peptide synthetase DhbF [Rhizobium sp. RU20A]|uniref:amino acid adenylation domain-containing protein n=1 Tax=Rhizobium sp. RU20A TaxID=1907412 RepID=UPI000955FE8D|nr:non-ribosomal peptide synthetase [Rhizobium sp. RU20A]SIR32013.1 nonribosomal peptide synthetase DhbF [Rhizobium sp. RU20A]
MTAQHTAAARTAPQDTAAETADWFGLSHAQRAVWLDMRLIEDPTAYQVGSVVTFRSAIDPDLARQAVRMMVGRHEALRLRIDRDEPRQRIEPAGRPPFRLIDLTEAADPEAAARAHVEAVHAKGFTLGDEPLFRVDLLKLGESHWRMMLLAHHLIADGVALGIAQAHWLTAYRTLSGDGNDDGSGTETVMPRSTYRSVVADDEAYAASPRHADDLAYWTARLSPMPGLVLDGLVLNGLAPVGIAERADSSAPEAEPAAPLRLGAETHAALEAQAKALGTTTPRVLLAIIAIALARRYRREDFTLGMALHRREAATRYTIGMLAGILPLRCRIDATTSLRRAITMLAADQDADLRHQRLPVDTIGRALAASGAFDARPDRNLFDVAVTIMPAMRRTAVQIGGRSVSSAPIRERERSPLGIYVDEEPDQAGIVIGFGHDPAILAARDVAGFATVLADVIDAVLADPDRRLDSIDGLEPAERAAIAVWSAGRMIEIPSLTLPDLFERQVAETPTALAAVSDTVSLDYAGLDQAANRVAARLIEAGIRHGDTVGVCLDRSVEGIAALIGILKAGATYLPLDPAYPAERLAGMIADARAVALITDVAKESLLPPEPRRILAADGWPLTGPATVAPDRTGLAPAARAYVIYTSGSTGTPKGVAVSHTALVNLAFARLDHDPIGPGDRVLAAISIGFDVSLGQMLTPLLSGAAVVVAGDIRGIAAATFWNFLTRHAVTHVNSVPSLFEAVLPDAPEKTALKQLMLGGEPLSASLAARLSDRLGIPVWNMYGPTETTIDATAWRFPEAGPARDRFAGRPLPIGRPLPNYTAHVLDGVLQPVGPGLEGELFIGGASLADGYLGRSDLTAERFIDHPHLGRLYRTGDRAAWNGDGTLGFLGRHDAQVKIRGFRIELGEIEAVLRRHATVAQAAVVARSAGGGEPRLLAYVVPAPGALPDGEALASFLSASLPAHMVPSAITVLDALPLTANGKLDLKALPDPAFAAQAGAAPETPTEVLVAGLFASLLGAAEITTASHFFALGGHSLMATQLASKLRDTLHVDLSLRMLFETPRLGDLAARIDALLGVPAAAATGLIPAAPRPATLPLSFEQERLWFLDRLEPMSAAYNIPVVLRLAGMLDRAALSSAFDAVVARHESLRTGFAEVDGTPVQIVHAERRMTLAIDEVTDAGAVHAAIEAEALRPFSLERNCLIRARLLSLAPDTHLLVVVTHHIVSDGLSASILMRELSAAYQAAHDGQPFNLTPLPIQYADYALWQREALTEAAVEEEVVHWRGVLANAPDALDLPLDRPRPAVRRSAGASLPLDLPPETAAAVGAFARAAGTTPFLVLSAAWSALLARWSGQDDIVFGAPAANRDRPELEGMVGFLVNTLVLRADLSGEASFRTLTERLTARASEAFAHATLPFEKLVDALSPPRQPGLHPVFQTMVALQPAMPDTFAFGSLTAHAVPLPEAAAKFDLTLVLSETAAGYSGTITYATDIFDRTTIQRLGRHFVTLLTAALKTPETPVRHLPLIPAEERAAMISRGTGERRAIETVAVPALFARQVAAQPQAPAVIYGDRTLSFEALDRRANRLAHHLIGLGVAAGRPVAVIVGRNERLPVIALAVLKAAGVYMPLDPANPAERMAGVFETAKPAVVITDHASRPRLPAIDPAVCAMLDMDAFDAADMPNSGLNSGPNNGPDDEPAIARAVTPADPAYIIHTSGSTGRPKGVIVSHAALANLAAARLAHDPVGPGDRVAATLSIGFDVSIGQILTPLLSGATVVVIDDPATLSGADFWGLLARDGVTHMNFSPAFLDAAIEAPIPPGLALRQLMLGGEAFQTAVARRIAAALPGVALFNMYGPSETVIDATAYRFRGTETDPVLPIGRPLPNYRTLILDARMEPVPTGITGEIYIGGDSVADGYIGRLEETASRFLPDPFGAPGERLYRTGDLARWTADGDIAFIGRADAQVKIRGHRIELDEVSAALRSHPAVRSAAVVTAKRQGETVLVAYAVTEDSAETPADWRSYLAARLPAAMLPATLVCVDVLPMTVNGKLDIAALPAPVFGTDTEAATPPRDDLDATLLGLWRELLGFDTLGIDHNFFAAGGHSLQALRLCAGVKRLLGLDLPVGALYRAQTVRALADDIRSGKALKTGGPLIKLGDGPGEATNRPPVFAFHPVGGAPFGYLGLAEALTDKRAVYGLQASGLDAGEAVAETLDAMVENYMAAMRSVQPKGPYALVGHSFGGLLAFEITRRLEATGEAVERLVMIDTSPAGEFWTMDMAKHTAARIVRLERDRAGSDAPIDPEQEQRVTAVVANNMRLSQSYKPERIETPLAYLRVRRGDQPPDPAREAYWTSRSARPDLQPAWDVDHFAVLNRDNAATLARFFQ